MPDPVAPVTPVAPVAPVTPVAPVAPVTPVAPVVPATFDWKSAGLDDVGMNTITTKQWKTPGDMLGSYVNLEKLVGAPPEQIIKLPKDMADPSMKDVWSRLGKPVNAADYKIEAIKGSDPEFSKTISSIFHDADVPVSMAHKITTKYNEHVAAVVTKQQTEYTAKVERENVALRTEWGAQHDSRIEIAKNAAKAFGVSAEQINALEKVMGFAGVHKMMYTIGSKIGEADFVRGGGKPGDFNGMTVDSAKAQIAALRADKLFVARFSSKDPVVASEARAEMRRYELVAFPGQQTV